MCIFTAEILANHKINDNMKKIILAMVAFLTISLNVCSQNNRQNDNKDNNANNMSTIYDFTALSNRGQEVNFADYRGKVLLIVNTASKCGFTPQYDGLEALYQKYKNQGLVVIGFPCDQFGHQEPGTNEQIEEFCRVNHGVTFPLMSKIEVNGENAHPIYKWLESQAGFAGFTPGHPLTKILEEMLSKADSAYASKPEIKWNFTKFLINRKGEVVRRFEPTVEPTDLEKPIEEQL